MFACKGFWAATISYLLPSTKGLLGHVRETKSSTSACMSYPCVHQAGAELSDKLSSMKMQFAQEGKHKRAERQAHRVNMTGSACLLPLSYPPAPVIPLLPSESRRHDIREVRKLRFRSKTQRKYGCRDV